MNILCSFFGGTYDDLWQAVIRPSRDDYKISDLGPYRFEISGKCYKRTDFELLNKRGYKLMCSFWEPFDEERENTFLPCVIYLHGNSSSRCEAFSEVPFLLPKNITLFSFDFCGCGKSEGEYISLGYYEQEDVNCVIEYLKKTNKVSKIALWGRSMGAVTALLYASKNQNKISAMILDSGFFSLKILINELVETKINLPQFFIDQMLKSVKKTVKEKANFNMDEIEPYLYIKNCKIPAFFIHGSNDEFVKPHHCQDLYKLYGGKDKILTFVKGNHNSPRSKKLREDVVKFLCRRLFDRFYMDDFNNRCTIKNSEKEISRNILKYKFSNKTNDIKLKKILLKNEFNKFINSSTDELNKIQKKPRQNIRTYSVKHYSKNDLSIIDIKNNRYNRNNSQKNINCNIKKNLDKNNIDIININNNKFNDDDKFSDIAEEVTVSLKVYNKKVRPMALSHKKIKSQKFKEILLKNNNNINNANYQIFKKNKINNISELLHMQTAPSIIKIIGDDKIENGWTKKNKDKLSSNTFDKKKKRNVKYIIQNKVIDEKAKKFYLSKKEIKKKEGIIKVNLKKQNVYLQDIYPFPTQNHIRVNRIIKTRAGGLKTENTKNDNNSFTQDTILDENEEIIGKKEPNK